MWEFWRSSSKLGKRANSGNDLASLERPSFDLLGPKISANVNFKDLTLSAEDDGDDGGHSDDEFTLNIEGDERQASPSYHLDSDTRSKGPKRPEKNKLIIIMVGLPGRGKTFLCNKLKCYLNWLGHDTKHINVGSYRRLQKGSDEVQDASFFDNSNPHGMEARNRALLAALEDMQAYLATEKGQVAILDATNSTEERRQLLVKHLHGRYQYLFIESSCTDDKVLQQNYLAKMLYSPDYKDAASAQKALDDFKERIRKYEEVYETLSNRNQHYIKLIDMVTGHGYMDVNRISGYIPGKIVFYLMQVCKAGLMTARKIWLMRHGESDWNLAGRLGGDSGLSPAGEDFARQLPELLVDRLPATCDGAAVPVSCWTSTLQRTIQTASFLPFPKLRWKALDEIHAGICDGLTYAEVEAKYPDEFAARTRNKLRYRYPSGESYLDVIQRLEPVIIELERERESVCIVAHQAVLRAIVGYFTAVPLEDIPSLEIPLHTIIELRPRPDGTMEMEHIHAADFTEGFPEASDSSVSSQVGSVSSFALHCPSSVGSAGTATAVFSRPGSSSTPTLPLPVPAKLSHKVPFGATASFSRTPGDHSHGSFGSLLTAATAAGGSTSASVTSAVTAAPIEATYDRSSRSVSREVSCVGSAEGWSLKPLASAADRDVLSAFLSAQASSVGEAKAAEQTPAGTTDDALAGGGSSTFVRHSLFAASDGSGPQQDAEGPGGPSPDEAPGAAQARGNDV